MTYRKRLWKTLCEKEKMLVISISSFSHNVFYLFKERNYQYSNIYFVLCKCFQIGHVQNFSFGKGSRSACIIPVIHQLFFKTFFVLFSRLLYIGAFECNTTSDWLNHMAKPYGFANHKLCFIPICKSWRTRCACKTPIPPQWPFFRKL